MKSVFIDKLFFIFLEMAGEGKDHCHKTGEVFLMWMLLVVLQLNKMTPHLASQDPA